MQKQCENNVWEKSNDAYSLSIRVQTTINRISIFQVCLLFHSISELIHLTKFIKFNLRGGLMVTAFDSRTRSPGSRPGRDIVLCACARHFTLTMPLSILTHWVGSWWKAFLWLSIDWYRQYQLISIYRLLFPIDWTVWDMFLWVPSFLLSACWDLKLHYICIRNGGSLSCILALSTHKCS